MNGTCKRVARLSLLVLGFASVAQGFALSQDVDPTSHRQDAVLPDQNWASGDFQAFRSAVLTPAISPALHGAHPDDLVLRSNDFVDPSEVTVVVRKPRSLGGPVYRLPQQNALNDTFDHLKHHLRTAAERGCSRVVFRKDELYEITPKAIGGRHLKLEGLEDCVIDLNGSTLRFTEPSVGMVISDCRRLTIQGGKIQGASVLASVAEVVRQNLHVSFKVLPEFASQLETAFPSGDVPLSTVGTAAKSGNGWGIATKNYFEWFVNRSGGRNRYRYNKDTQQFDPAGFHLHAASIPDDVDRVWLLHHNNSGHAIFLDNQDGQGIDDLTIRDITFQNIPGMMIAGEINRGLHLNRLISSKDDDNPLSLFAVASDTIHINGSAGDMVIENCRFGPSVDDKINIKSNFWRVCAIHRESDSVTVEPAGRKTTLKQWGTQGQRVVFVNEHLQPIGQSLLVQKTDGLEEKRSRLTLNQIPADLSEGVLAVNADTAGSRVIIRNNHFTGTRAQGVLVQTSNTKVVDNVFEDIAGPAIKLNFALKDWYESICPSNVVIQNNTFLDCAFSPTKSPEIIHVQQLDPSGDTISIISNVRIENNRLLPDNR